MFGDVGIDMVAGPSEVVVIADRAADPAWIAADLLAQAEHDPMARAVLITDAPALLPRVEAALAAQLEALPRRAIAAEALGAHGAFVLVEHRTRRMFQLAAQMHECGGASLIVRSDRLFGFERAVPEGRAGPGVDGQRLGTTQVDRGNVVIAGRKGRVVVDRGLRPVGRRPPGDRAHGRARRRPCR